MMVSGNTILNKDTGTIADLRKQHGFESGSHMIVISQGFPGPRLLCSYFDAVRNRIFGMHSPPPLCTKLP